MKIGIETGINKMHQKYIKRLQLNLIIELLWRIYNEYCVIIFPVYNNLSEKLIFTVNFSRK